MQGTFEWQNKDPVAFQVTLPQINSMMTVGIYHHPDPLHNLCSEIYGNCKEIPEVTLTFEKFEDQHKSDKCFL